MTAYPFLAFVVGLVVGYFFGEVHAFYLVFKSGEKKRREAEAPPVTMSDLHLPPEETISSETFEALRKKYEDQYTGLRR